VGDQVAFGTLVALLT